MSKKCTPVWREAHFEVKMYKTHHVRTRFRCSFAWQAQGIVDLVKSEQNVRVLYHFQPQPPLHYTTRHSNTLNYTTTTTTPSLHSTTLHYTTPHSIAFNHTTLHYTTFHCTTSHYTPLHYTSLHYTTTTTAQLHSTTLR